MVLQNAAAAGASVFTASGDHGSTCAAGSNTYPNNVDVPADAPHGTAVGGTTLQVGPGNVYQSETWWNDTSAAHGCSSLPCAGGFGSSTLFAAPPWQAGLAGSMRSVPDVAADGDPATGIQLCQQDFGGCPQMIGGQPLLQGGTSMAAPAWAAGTALINQALGHLTGNWNQVLYAQRASNAFHPPSSMGSDFAHVGLGSFDLGNLAAVLQPAPMPTSTAVPPTSTPGPPAATAVPRPNVGVGVAPNPAAHTLQATLVARNTCTAANQLQSIQFTRLTNATVDVPTSLAATVTAPGTVILAGSPATITLTVHRVNAGQAATVEMIVTDGCGTWPTFVGGGPSAF
jgi:subtilase family serine protease